MSKSEQNFSERQSYHCKVWFRLLNHIGLSESYKAPPISIFEETCLNFSKSNDEAINLGMATYPPAQSNFSAHDTFDHRTLVYRPYNGEFYGSSTGKRTFEKSHTNDIIKFIFDPKNESFIFKKVTFFGFHRLQRNILELKR